ncbi:MAG: hypothetical protein JW819_09495 [Candidatus Krumholzibacteriota bacterium]|nr:hypothetical protein [Candidatus Krumholzibacteriota bacterium]
MSRTKTAVRTRRPTATPEAESAPAAPEDPLDELELPTAVELFGAWLPGWLATPLAVVEVRIVPGERLEKAATPVEPVDPLSRSIYQSVSGRDERFARRERYYADLDSRKKIVSFDFARELARGVAAAVEKSRVEVLTRWRRLYDDRGVGAVPNFVKWKARCIRLAELTEGKPSIEVLSGEIRLPTPGPEPERFKDPGLFVEKIFDDLASTAAICEKIRAYRFFETVPEPFPIPAALAARVSDTEKAIREEYAQARFLLEQIPQRREFDQILDLAEIPAGRVRDPQAVEDAFLDFCFDAWERAKKCGPCLLAELTADEPHPLPWIEKNGTWAEDLVPLLRTRSKGRLECLIRKDGERLEALADDESGKADERQRRFAEKVAIEERIKKNERKLAGLEA